MGAKYVVPETCLYTQFFYACIAYIACKKMKNLQNVIFRKIAKSVPVECTKNRETTSIAYADIHLKYHSCTIPAIMPCPYRTSSFKKHVRKNVKRILLNHLNTSR